MSKTSTALVPDMTNSSTSLSLPSMKQVKDFIKTVPVSMGLFAAVVVLLSFFLLSTKTAYKFTNDNLSNVVGKTLDEKTGCPSDRGVMVHAIVGAVVVGLVVYFSHDYVAEQLKKLMQ
jgi:hypothetical protein